MGAMLVWLGLYGQASNPQRQFELFGRDAPPECHPASLEELKTKHNLPQGKASTFHLSGFYRCNRPIFEYHERASFDQFVADHIGARADDIALSVTQLIDQSHGLTINPNTRIVISLQTDRAGLSPLLRSALENSLQSHLASKHVSVLKTAPMDAKDLLTLRVVLRNIDDKIHFLGASLVQVSDEGTLWVDL
ncbi:MAG: hypothetical protein NTV34_20515 [Proteobacteria bacterium]|nr:hypothetical protein [Pseudomonadota bacterium]